MTLRLDVYTAENDLSRNPPPFWLVGLLGNPGTHARGYAAVHQAAAACSSRCVLYIGSVGCSAACLPIIAEYQQAVGVGERTLSVAADLDRSHRVAGRVLDLHRRRLQPLPPLLTAPSTHAPAATYIWHKQWRQREFKVAGTSLVSRLSASAYSKEFFGVHNFKSSCMM